MRWLILRQLRPFLITAGGAGVALNLALLIPSIYILSTRYLAVNGGQTLWVLSALALLAVVLGYGADRVRAAALARAGRALELLLAPTALEELLQRSADGAARRGGDVLRDISQLRSFMCSSAMLAVFDAPWILVYVVFIALLHPLLGLTVFADAIFLFAVALPAEKQSRIYAEVAARCGHETADHARALTRCAGTIIGMGMSKAVIEAWRQHHHELLDAQEQLSRALSRLAAAARMSRQASQVIVLSLGAWLVVDQRSFPGVVIAAALLLARAQQPVEQLVNGWKAMIDARCAWSRLGEKSSVALRPESASRVTRGVSLRAVTCAPSVGSPALIDDLCLDIEPGESIGIVGRSGSGKTTLVRLVLGILRPQSGSISLDGTELTHWDRERLGQQVGYLPQGPELMPATVGENIARLNAVDRGKVEEAARLANAHEMILAFPQGYATQLGEGHLRLSGGQRQRIALARALYGNPSLVLLDEPHANLDSAGELALADTLKQLKLRGVTLIVVAHRTPLLRALDRLLVLENGRLHDLSRQPRTTGPRSITRHDALFGEVSSAGSSCKTSTP
jgi:PrtD family type I secretion system ABC transporter